MWEKRKETGGSREKKTLREKKMVETEKESNGRGK